MNYNELLVKNYISEVLSLEENIYLKNEEYEFLLKELANKDFYLNEGIMDSLRGLDKSVIIPLLILKFTSLGDVSNVSAKTLSRFSNSGSPEVSKVINSISPSVNTEVSEEDAAEALKIHTNNTQYSRLNVHDIEKKDFIESFFNSGNEKEIKKIFYENLEKGDDVFAGIYTKATFNILSGKTQNKLMSEVFDFYENMHHKNIEDFNLKEIKIGSEFKITIGKLDESHRKSHAKQLVDIFFKDKFTIKSNSNTKDVKEIKNKLKNFLLNVAKEAILDNLNYHPFSNGSMINLNNIYSNVSYIINNKISEYIEDKNIKDLNIEIEFNDIKDNSLGGLILTRMNIENKKSFASTLQHEIGHALSLGNLKGTNMTNLYYSILKHFSDNGIKLNSEFRTGDVVSFLLNVSNKRFNIDIDSIDDLNESGREKLKENAIKIIKSMIGSNAIENIGKDSKGYKFKLLVDEKVMYDKYYHLLEERIENILMLPKIFSDFTDTNTSIDLMIKTLSNTLIEINKDKTYYNNEYKKDCYEIETVLQVKNLFKSKLKETFKKQNKDFSGKNFDSIAKKLSLMIGSNRNVIKSNLSNLIKLLKNNKQNSHEDHDHDH